jgi:hypothetical protein
LSIRPRKQTSIETQEREKHMMKRKIKKTIKDKNENFKNFKKKTRLHKKKLKLNKY